MTLNIYFVFGKQSKYESDVKLNKYYMDYLQIVQIFHSQKQPTNQCNHQNKHNPHEINKNEIF